MGLAAVLLDEHDAASRARPATATRAREGRGRRITASDMLGKRARGVSAAPASGGGEDGVRTVGTLPDVEEHGSVTLDEMTEMRPDGRRRDVVASLLEILIHEGP